IRLLLPSVLSAEQWYPLQAPFSHALLPQTRGIRPSFAERLLLARQTLSRIATGSDYLNSTRTVVQRVTSAMIAYPVLLVLAICRQLGDRPEAFLALHGL